MGGGVSYDIILDYILFCCYITFLSFDILIIYVCIFSYVICEDIVGTLNKIGYILVCAPPVLGSLAVWPVPKGA